MKYALLLDEFIYLISNQRLIKYSADRAILHKYKIMVTKCKGNPKCFDVCKEYNMNKFSYMFDGEGLFIKDFLKKFRKMMDYLIDVKKIKKLFEMK